MFKCLIAATVLLAASAPFATAQTTPASNTYVFPMFVDGTSGSQVYHSVLRLSRTVAGTTPLQCSVVQRNTASPFVGVTGMVYSADILDAGFSPPALSVVTLDPYLPWEILRTNGQEALKTGYAKITCAAAVDTQLQFSLSDTKGNKSGEVSVTPATQGLSFQFLIDRRDGTRLGFSLANDNNNFMQFAVIARDQYNYEVGRTYDTIEGLSQVSHFIDEELTLPADFVGSIELAAVGTAPLYSIGLQYTGGVFTTVQPIVRSAPIPN